MRTTEASNEDGKSTIITGNAVETYTITPPTGVSVIVKKAGE